MAVTPTQKKYIIAGIIGAITIAGGLAYLQYKKLMNYALTFRSVRINKISLTKFDFDLILNFQNKSDVAFTIKSQSYDIYLNNVFVTRINNDSDSVMLANATSPMGLNISFNPQSALQKLHLGALAILKADTKLTIKVDMKMKVKLWVFTISIPYVYEDTLKNMMGIGQPATV